MLIHIDINAQQVKSTLPERYVFHESWESNSFDYDIQTRYDRYNSISGTCFGWSIVAYIAGQLAYYMVFAASSDQTVLKTILLGQLSGIGASIPFIVFGAIFNDKASQLQIKAEGYRKQDLSCSGTNYINIGLCYRF